MATWNDDSPDVGDDLSGVRLNTFMQSGQSAINDLELAAIERRSLRREHFSETFVYSQGQKEEERTAGYNIITTYPGWSVVAGWQVLDLTGGTSAATTAGDAPSTKMEFELQDVSGAARTVDLSGNEVFGLEVAFDVEVKSIVIGAAPSRFYRGIMLGVQYYDGTVWRHWSRSNRFTHGDYDAQGSVETWDGIAFHGLITSAEHNGVISRLRLVACGFGINPLAALSPSGVITRAALTAWALRSDG